MKKLLMVGIIVAVLCSLMAVPALAKAQKVVLNPYDDGGASSDPGSGFVVLNNSTGGAELTVSLKGATPKAKYEVCVFGEPPVSSVCYGIMTTNGKGNANFHVNGKDVPGAELGPREYKVVVALELGTGATIFITEEMTMNIKEKLLWKACWNNLRGGRAESPAPLLFLQALLFSR